MDKRTLLKKSGLVSLGLSPLPSAIINLQRS
jgi:hypothetical protein